MGKANKNKVSTKFQTSASNISKHVTSKQPNAEPTNAKERIEQELGLLHVRKQAIHLNNTGDTMTHKVKKKATMKRGANARQQKKIARALLIADKEETKLEKQNEKAEMKKLRKNVWS